MKEAPRDKLACEATILRKSTHIQGGCDLVLVAPETSAVAAISKSLFDESGSPTVLSDIIKDDDYAQLKADFENPCALIPRIVTRMDGAQTWVRPYRVSGLVGLEFSPKDEPLTTDQYSNHHFASLIKDLSHRHELAMNRDGASDAEYFQMLVQGVRQLTKFDRVMIYRFDPDWNGEVIAEDTGKDINRYFGLKFPSGDIPRPARELFLHSKVRQIIDVDAEPELMISPDGQQPFAFDQSDSAFRYSSSIHLDYLRNMGVTASLTIAIKVGGQLWGLLSCHHQSGRHRVSLSQLSLCNVLGDLASNHVARQEEQRRSKLKARVSSVLSDISVASIAASSEDDLASIVVDHEKRLLGIIGADGLQFESETANWIIGAIPRSNNLLRIDQIAQEWLREHERGYLATADIAGFLDQRAEVGTVQGGLVYAHSWDSKTRLKAFRKAQRIDEVWAGNPDAEADYVLENPDIMHPRNSFKAFNALAIDKSENWLPEEIAAIDSLQVGLRNIEMSFHKSMRERQLRHSNAEMRNALTKADHQAKHDPLTGLLNRRGLEDFIAKLTPRNNRQETIWFCHIDLDHFKSINDELGHGAGDALLIHLAEALQYNQPSGGKAARIGGDEFAVLLAGNLNKTQARDACMQIIQDAKVPFDFEASQLSCSCTIGVTKFVPGQTDIKRLLKESDMALYQGKRIGRGRVVCYSQDMMDASSQRRKLETDLLRGIAAKEFIPYFQPQYDCSSERVVGFEALSRWRHPEKGVLQPGEFLTIAAELGVLGDIDRLIFHKAVEQQKKWFKNTGQIVRMSVNISVDRLRSLDLVADLKQLGDWSKHISLELLESIYLDNHEADYEGIIRRLRQTGVEIEIDDFGTGQTSILAVVLVKPDRLKIDKRLIDPIVTDCAARGLIKAIMDIGGQLGIKIVAEGVETEEQFRVLQHLECDRVQGYLFAKPLASTNIKNDFLGGVWGGGTDGRDATALLN